jgi:hypothetical protein
MGVRKARDRGGCRATTIDAYYYIFLYIFLLCPGSFGRRGYRTSAARADLPPLGERCAG